MTDAEILRMKLNLTECSLTDKTERVIFDQIRQFS